MHTWLIGLILLISPLAYGTTLTIATTADNPPFSTMIDTHHHYFGFDINIMDEVCKRLHVTCIYNSMIFDQLFSTIATGEADLAIASITITPERQKFYLFSEPYLASKVQFMALGKSSINTMPDLEKKNIGVRAGTPFKKLALRIYKNKVNIIEYAQIADLLKGLNHKEVDAIMMDRGSAQYWYANNGNQYKLLRPAISYGGGFGIMGRLGQEALMKDVNLALNSMLSDGTYSNIYMQYFTPAFD